MAKIEMPQEPEVDQVWTRDPDGAITEWSRSDDGWRLAGSRGLAALRFGELLRDYRAVYTTHPDLAALDKYPAPWSASAAGTVRDATGKAVLDPTQQCPPCLTRLIVRAVNELAERNAPSATTEDDKR